MSILNEISENLQRGKAKIVKELVEKALAEGCAPADILNEGLLDGMSIIGEKFKNNEVYVPEVLVAARAMNMGTQVLKPRLIAELIQVESRQPFLLLPTRNEGNIYFCPPTHLGNPKFVGRQKLGQIIAFIAPKQIIVLGNERYVPEEYVKELRKVAPVFVVNTENWQQAADMVAPMLNLSKLPRDFSKLSAQLESGRLYVPEKNADKKSDAAENTEDKDSTVAEEPVFKEQKKAKPAKKSEETTSSNKTKKPTTKVICLAEDEGERSQ